MGKGEHFGEARAKKSLRIALSTSLDLTFGMCAPLYAPFDASAVIKSLIKLMSDIPREPGVGEKEDRRHRQLSAANVLMLQAVVLVGLAQQAGNTQDCLKAGLGPENWIWRDATRICRMMRLTDTGVCSSF